MSIARMAALIAASAAFGATAQPARAPGLPALRAIEPGLWELREPSARAGARVCVSDPAMLVQLRHRGATCSRYVIDNQPTLATLHYTCPGAGYGRTTIRIETPTLIQLSSQGIAGNSPFEVRYEGRRQGDCR